MNIFAISPGRTGTTTMAAAFDLLEGFTAAHESRVQMLGSARLDYPTNHIECDNRLVFFLADLSLKYGRDSILVRVERNRDDIATSYGKRWAKMNIMKAWSQGVHLRDLSLNNDEVIFDYIDFVYRQIEFFQGFFREVITIDIDSPRHGTEALLTSIGRAQQLDEVLDVLSTRRENIATSGLRKKLADLWFNVRATMHDLRS